LLGNRGLVVGSIYAAYIVETIGLRWVFYIATIASGISAVAALGMKESRATSLLDQRVEKIKKETGYDNLKAESSVQKLTLSPSSKAVSFALFNFSLHKQSSSFVPFSAPVSYLAIE
jgi:MFS family permease